jgi:hypothetical protein
MKVAEITSVDIRTDEHGFKWLVLSCAQAIYPSLVADLQAASKVFVDSNFGAQLLCAMTVFAGQEDTQAALVYLYKRGSSRLTGIALQSGDVA